MRVLRRHLLVSGFAQCHRGGFGQFHFKQSNGSSVYAFSTQNHQVPLKSAHFNQSNGSSVYEVGGVELSVEAFLCRPCYTSLWRAAKRENSRFFRKEDYNENWSDAAKVALLRGKEEQCSEFNAMLASIARARVKSGDVWLQCKPIH